eukprot:TRINITY_DN8395_c0_g1_i1.p1 TRINITY_DN8395_c0_g1~~TRINITY_DN8395_c0_g1_i1.p1  ORF type:complete len:150 (+),score=28.38 TRINITY_DN8395_c0_g1_i1:28-450(+)
MSEVGEPPRKKVKTSHLSPIAKPLADKKLTKKILKLNKKATKDKQVRRGVKEVVKAIRKKETGLCVIAGDISPIDVITHLPVYCEENNIQYVYVASKHELGKSSGCKRPTSCVLITAKDSKLQSKLSELIDEVRGLPRPS